jgi:FG-GAP-like repeat
VGDINGDGHPDSVTTGAPTFGGCFNSGNCSDLAPMFGDGTGAFTGPVSGGTDHVGPKTPALADFNGDGKLDLAAPECSTKLRSHAGVPG